eukprot:573135-Pelagomonas_calceolata.AAC.9
MSRVQHCADLVLYASPTPELNAICTCACTHTHTHTHTPGHSPSAYQPLHPLVRRAHRQSPFEPHACSRSPAPPPCAAVAAENRAWTGALLAVLRWACCSACMPESLQATHKRVVPTRKTRRWRMT